MERQTDGRLARRMTGGTLLLMGLMLVGIFAIGPGQSAARHVDFSAASLTRTLTISPLSWPTARRVGMLQDDAQDDAQDEQEETEEERFKRYRGRLPNYFARVIDEQQRQEIYQLQAKFNEQIASLQEQIDTLAMERDELVEGVLTAEQRAEVEKMREEARQRRQSSGNSGDGNAPDPDSY